jgi:hypothetical protein
MGIVGLQIEIEQLQHGQGHHKFEVMSTWY